MITPEEEHACRKWLRRLIAEKVGPPLPQIQPGMSVYPIGSTTLVLKGILPESIIAKMQASAQTAKGFQWTELDEAELGTVMQAGAARFLPEVTEKL